MKKAARMSCFNRFFENSLVVKPVAKIRANPIFPVFARKIFINQKSNISTFPAGVVPVKGYF